MKRLSFLLLIGLFLVHFAQGQVKIGNNPEIIDNASVLELESTDKVLVITRVTTAQMNAITPLAGAMVYNTDLQSVHYFDGVQWIDIGSGGGSGDGLTADPIVNDISTIAITPTVTGNNLEVAPNSIGTLQIQNGGINGTEDIQDNSIGPGKIQDQSVTQEKLSENSVGAFALDNDNIGLSAFNNDVGYITSASIVSIDGGNALQIGTDNGAYYDETPLINAIQDNADDIAADNDQNASNEIQNLTLTGSVIGLTDTAGTIDIGPLVSGGGSDDQNIGPVTFDAGTNELSVGIEGGNPGTVNLGALVSDGSETRINSTATITVTGNGTIATPYELTAVGGGGGSTEVADQTTITGVGTAGDPFKIEPGGNGQFLTTDAGGAVIWQTVTPGGGTTEVVDGTLLTGLGTAGDPFTIAPGGADEILRTNAAGTAVAWVPLPTGGAVISDGTLTGDGSSAGTALSLADDAVTSAKISNATILAEDLNQMGATDGQVLKWDDATTSWITAADATGTATLNDGNIYVGDAANTPQGVALSGDATIANTGELTIADDAIELNMIAQNGATDGQVLKWDDATTSWITAADATGTATLNDGNIFVGDATNAPQGVALSGDATIANTGELTIADDAIELNMIAQNGATDDGDIMQWNTDINGDGSGGGWEIGPSANVLGNNPNNVFFAGPGGELYDTESNDDPGVSATRKDNGGFFWDSSKRFNTGALYLGLKLNGASETNPLGESAIGDHSKLVVVERLGGQEAYPLQLVNEGATAGTGTGILFANDTNGNHGGAALIYERIGPQSQGDFHFLSIASGTSDKPTVLNDKVFSVENDGDIKIFRGIDINGVGFGTAGQVLASGGAGNPLQWVNAGGTAVTDTDANDGLSDFGATTGYNVNVDDTTIEIVGDDLQIKDGAITPAKINPAPGTLPLTQDQILVTDKDTGVVSWEDLPTGTIPAGGTNLQMLTTDGAGNLSWTNARATEVTLNPTLDLDNNPVTPNEANVQDAITTLAAQSGNLFSEDGLVLNANRTHDLNNNNLVLGGSGNVAIGTLPGAPQSKLDVNGQIQARDGFAAAEGTSTTPSYGFFTNNDTDTGMYRPGADQIGFTVGGNNAVTISEPSAGTTSVLIEDDIELDGTLTDVNGQPGNANQILSATGAGVEWIDFEGPIQKAKVSTTEDTGGSGEHSVSFPNMGTNQYIINLSVEEVTLGAPIFISVVNQTNTGFTVRITELIAGAVNTVPNATWHYTVYNP